MSFLLSYSLVSAKYLPKPPNQYIVADFILPSLIIILDRYCFAFYLAFHIFILLFWTIAQTSIMLSPYTITRVNCLSIWLPDLMEKSHKQLENHWQTKPTKNTVPLRPTPPKEQRRTHVGGGSQNHPYCTKALRGQCQRNIV